MFSYADLFSPIFHCAPDVSNRSLGGNFISKALLKKHIGSLLSEENRKARADAALKQVG